MNEGSLQDRVFCSAYKLRRRRCVCDDGGGTDGGGTSCRNALTNLTWLFAVSSNPLQDPPALPMRPPTFDRRPGARRRSAACVLLTASGDQQWARVRNALANMAVAHVKVPSRMWWKFTDGDLRRVEVSGLSGE